MIYDTPIIKIGSVPYPIYDANLEGGGENAAKVTVKFINESGNYISPEIGESAFVQIGNFFNFNGIIENTVTEESAGGNFLEIKITDRSIILDQYYVGLSGKHGIGFGTIVSGGSNRVILLGQQIDPCEGVDEINDPCAPCADEDGTPIAKLIDCQKNREIKILDVNYSFSELLTSISNIGIAIQNPFIPNDDYRAQHTGNLREVLSAWCEDYGWSFYWSAETDSLNFIDRKVGININDDGIENGCTLESKRIEKSVDNLDIQGNISYFGVDGEIQDYQCKDNGEWEYAKELLLRPLSLEDVLVGQNGQIDPFVRNNYLASYHVEKMIALSIYSQYARDLYALYEIYGIEEAQDLENLIQSDGNKTLNLLGNLQPRLVCHKNSSNKNNLAIYNKYFQKGSSFSPFSSDQIDTMVNAGVYIVVGTFDNAIREKFINFETELAENCMGRYWYRYFSADLTNGFDYTAPDGTMNYYKRGAAIQFDFLSALPRNLSSISSFLNEIQEGKGRAIDNFVVLERNQSWVPSPKADDGVVKFAADCENRSMFGKNNSASDVGLVKSLIKENEVVLFFYPRNALNVFNISPSGPSASRMNILEAENKDVPFSMYGKKGTYGLRSVNTKGFSVATNNSSFDITYPVQSGFTPGVNYGGYSVLGRGRYVASDGFGKVLLPKTEVVRTDIPPFNNQAKKLKVVYKNLTDQRLSVLDENCLYNTGKVISVLEEESRNLSQSSIENQTTITYSLNGIPNVKKDIRDGLISFSIGIGSNGTTSNLVFSNSFPIGRTDTMTKNQIEFLLKNPSFKRMIQTQYQKKTSKLGNNILNP